MEDERGDQGVSSRCFEARRSADPDPTSRHDKAQTACKDLEELLVDENPVQYVHTALPVMKPDALDRESKQAATKANSSAKRAATSSARPERKKKHLIPGAFFHRGLIDLIPSLFSLLCLMI